MLGVPVVYLDRRRREDLCWKDLEIGMGICMQGYGLEDEESRAVG